MSWKSAGNLLGWICQHPVVLLIIIRDILRSPNICTLYCKEYNEAVTIVFAIAI